MKPAYYNEIDPFAAAWLRELIAAGEIAAGDVDTRSIADVRADDLVPYGQCHFFAGIGGWSLALRLAGVPDDVPIWTGSCPCQPFSVAGKGRGVDDERHLWPELRRLIDERRPAVCFGEQTAGRAGLDWLASVRADLEGMAYAVGAADLCAAGVGAPHIRQRIYWGGVADSNRSLLGSGTRAAGKPPRIAEPDGRGGHGGVADAGRLRLRGEGPRPAAGAAGGVQAEDGQRERLRSDARAGGAATGGLGDADLQRRDGLDALLRASQAGRVAGRVPQAVGSGEAGRGMGDASGEGLARSERGTVLGARRREEGRATSEPGPAPDDPWRTAGRVECSDGRSRPTAPLARRVDDGLLARVVLLRGYGNAIVPQVGAVFVRSFFEAAGVMA